MKLIRFRGGKKNAGTILQDSRVSMCPGLARTMTEAFFAEGGLVGLEQWLSGHTPSAPRVAQSVRLGPSIVRPSKIVCIGLNFRDHAQESKMEIPIEPVIFFKATTSLVGPNDDLVIPKNGSAVDWEVELAVVIGKKASYVERGDALQYVAGYVLHNDYSERVFQLERGGQWVKGKSADSFAPTGPVSGDSR